ncbi:hypothetical protein CTEN210_09911 [Chaetoceros tenuissimus]|uniref:Leucine-rich repeat-containing N-terminal plant-type domain-containing protein n=1 Tax=Chaetoceros tenuissimus TaxID=426638 RepID=A0AAD3H7N8_9STRA|nr:hypothetical protein CTEN210_09911 [Chaetoceros tenuissimus]
MSVPTSTYSIDRDDEKSRESSGDMLGSSAALQVRQLERERRLREIERTFQNVVDESTSTSNNIYENVFTERGQVHNDDAIRNKEFELAQAAPKTIGGKLKEKVGQKIRRKSEFDFELQAKAAAGSFDDFLPATDFSSHKYRDRPPSPNHARVAYNVTSMLRQHASKIGIGLLLFIAIVATSATLGALRDAPIPVSITEETWQHLKAIRTVLVDEGVNKKPLNDYESKQFLSLTQLAEEVTMGTLSIDAIKEKATTDVNTEGHASGFNKSYKQRRILLERYTMMILYYETTPGTKDWNNKNKWLSNDSVCEWHGVDCTELDGKEELKMNVINEIRLTDNGLSGSLPEELGLMASLEVLKLENNFLQGGVPEEIGNIKTLQRAHFSKNIMTGVMPEPVCKLKEVKLEELVADCGSDFDCECCTECL